MNTKRVSAKLSQRIRPRADTPNQAGFQLVIVFHNGLTGKGVVQKRENGSHYLHTIPPCEYSDITGWLPLER